MVEDHLLEKIGTMSVGIINWLSALLGVYMWHKFERKILLYYGMIGMSIWLNDLFLIYYEVKYFLEIIKSESTVTYY